VQRRLHCQAKNQLGRQAKSQRASGVSLEVAFCVNAVNNLIYY
jgi:hypothetical protein